MRIQRSLASLLLLSATAHAGKAERFSSDPLYTAGDTHFGTYIEGCAADGDGR
jgi:hypothetical protein